MKQITEAVQRVNPKYIDLEVSSREDTTPRMLCLGMNLTVSD
jgi:hypothetical protein